MLKPVHASLEREELCYKYRDRVCEEDRLLFPDDGFTIVMTAAVVNARRCVGNVDGLLIPECCGLLRPAYV